MQATTSDLSKSYSQQKQQENQEKTNDSNLDTGQPDAGLGRKKNDASLSEKKSVKKPSLVSNQAEKKSDDVLEGIAKGSASGVPVSPRGIKPLKYLQMPESEKNLPKSPRSPRSPREDISRNEKESELKSLSQNDVVEMADSLNDAFRSFGSPRKEQPKPRRLESRRGIDGELASNQTSTTTINSTTQSTTTITSVVSVGVLPSIVPEDIKDTSDRIAQSDMVAQSMTEMKITGGNSLPNEPGYQPGQIFIKARRRISMPKVMVSVSDIAPTASSHKAPAVKYSKEAQMSVLADMMVADYIGSSVNPKDMGSLGRTDSALDLNQLPAELVEFKDKLKAKNKPESNHLMQAIFWSEFEAGEAWKKAIAIDHKFSRSGYQWTPRSGSFEGVAEKQLVSMLGPFAENFALCLFKNPSTLASLGVSDDLKNFLCMLDQKFVDKLIDQDSRATKGEKGCHPLSMKNIDQFRAYFLMHILVSRFIQPMLISTDRSQTAVSMMMLKLEMQSMNKLVVELSKDFQQRSYEKFPEDLQAQLIKKSEEELKVVMLDRGKNRFMEMKTKNTQKHMRLTSNSGVINHENPLEERARIENNKTHQRKQIDGQLSQILGELNINKFPLSLREKIDGTKSNWFSFGEQVSNHGVMTHLLKTVRDLIIEKNIDAELINFEVKLSQLASESLAQRAKRRATMPVSLGDLDFLNAILDQNISTDYSVDAKGNINRTSDTATTTNTTATTTTTTTTTTEVLTVSSATGTTTDAIDVNPVITPTMTTLTQLPESNSSGTAPSNRPESNN